MDVMKYRVLICGSRDFKDQKLISEFVSKNKDKISVIIEGGARGADRCARIAAEAFGIPVETYPADWQRYKFRAGPIRNQQMLDEGRPDVVVAYPLPGSKGTWDMINRAKKAGVPVKIIE